MNALAPVPGGTGTKHTRGPWKVEIYDKSGLATIRGNMSGDRSRESDGTGEIAEINLAMDGQFDEPMFPGQREDMIANAHLIAVAPELLESLTALLDAYSYYFPVGNPWADKGRAVLAKATPPVPGGA